MRGNSIVSDAGTTLAAGGKIELNAAENHYRNEDTHRSRRSGFTFGMRNGVANIGYSQSRNRTTQDNDLTAAVSSRVGSLNDDTVIAAGERIDTRTAQLFAGRDLALQSKEVNLGAAYVQENTRTEHQSSGFGLNLNLKAPAPELRQLQKYGEAVSKTRQQQGNVADKMRTWETNHAAAFEQWMPAASSSLTRQKSHGEDTRRYLRAVGSGSGDIRLEAAQNHYTDHEYHEERKSGLMGSGGLGFTIGQRKTTDNDDGTSLIHSGSSVTSKGGDIRMTAGGHYRQSGSRIDAGGDADVHARSIDVSAVNDRYSNQHIHTYQQKGLTVSLDIGPLQAAQNLYQSARTIGQSRHGRTNAMAAANTGWQAYQLIDGYKGGRLLDTSNLSLSVGYGQQKNRSEVRSDLSRVQESSINAGGKTRLHATGAGQASNITVTGSDIQGAGGTLLAADNRILLQSATFGQNEESRHQSSGWNVGATARYDGKPNIGITVGGQTGHGNGHGAGESHRHSHIGNKDSQTILQSGGDTTLRGAQVAGKGIQADVQNLSIESVQDTAAYQGRQKSGGAQISAGYGGVGINGHYRQSQLDADHRSVTEQSGLYAGDDGYQIHVRAHTELNGGLITSSQSAEDNGKNHFSTGTLGFGDLHNHSHYQGESLGMDAGVSRSNKTQGQQSDAQPDDKNRLSNTAGKNGTGHGIGYGSDSDRQESITRSGINTSNLQITDEAGQIRQTGLTAEETRAKVSTGTTTESAQADAGSLHNRFDKERVENEINLQRNVSQNFGHNVQQANGEINRHLDHLKEQLQQGKISQAEYDRQMALWQRGQVLLNSIASGLSAPTQSSAGIAANAVSPAVSYQIGQYFKELAANNRDGQLSAGQEAAHILAHTVWGAAVAHAGGNNALAGALAAGGPEAAAPIISHYLYQERDGSRLSAEQKETVTAITGLLGTAAGAALGSTPVDAAQGSLNAKNAINNNFNLDDLKDAVQRATGSLVGVALSGLSMVEPILKPRETANGIKAIMNSPNKAQLIEMGIILMVKERNDDYELFTRNNQKFGQGIVIGRSVADVGFLAAGGSGVVKFLARSPRMFEAALRTLKATGRVTVNGVNLVYAAGKIMLAPVRPPSRAAIDNAIRRTAATGNGRRVVEEIGIRPNSGTPQHMTQVKPTAGAGSGAATVRNTATRAKNSIFDSYPQATTLNLGHKTLLERAQFLSQHIPGLPVAQAKVILEMGARRNTSIVIGGSRVRGNATPKSDIDIGFGHLNPNQADKALRQIKRDSAKIPDALKVEDTVIAPGNKTPNIPEIASPEEFFQRQGNRAGRDKMAGQPFHPSGSVTIHPNGIIQINPPRK